MTYKQIITKGKIKVNEGYEGETIENKIERIVTQNEPITDGAPLIYTERVQGVLPEYDVRTDRFEVAIDAMNIVQKAEIAKREQRLKDKAIKPSDEVTSIQATDKL